MILFAFICLQVLDVVTTLLFLSHGAQEANPVIRAALVFPAHPIIGLALAKLFAIGLATLAWRSRRTKLLRLVNLVFAGCVVWNLIAVLFRQAIA